LKTIFKRGILKVKTRRNLNPWVHSWLWTMKEFFGYKFVSIIGTPLFSMNSHDFFCFQLYKFYYVTKGKEGERKMLKHFYMKWRRQCLATLFYFKKLCIDLGIFVYRTFIQNKIKQIVKREKSKNFQLIVKMRQKFCR
jgi:hypothetical protein